ncbi:MAG: XdhC family protein [Caulobacter sp.]|nr:XdhC family protein [Caulobacter sp.]
MSWAAQALTAVTRGEALAMVTVVAAEGSTPREAGTRMLVGARGQSGTIGGGALEHRATEQCRRMLGSERSWALQDYPLGPFLQQCCGGHVRLLLERLDAGSAGWLGEVAALETAGERYQLEGRVRGDHLQRSILPAKPGRGTAEGGGGGSANASGPVLNSGLSGRSGAAPSTILRMVPLPSALRLWGGLDEVDQWPGALIRMVDANGQPLPGRRPKLSEGDALIERIDARKPRLVLFGAGHVGQAIARAFAPLPFALDWHDSREEAAGPGVAVHDEARLVEIAAAVGEADYVLILTHNHDLDYQLTRAVLTAGGGRYTGLIGSDTKRARFLRRLRDDGVSEATIARLTCPIGLPGLKSKAPEVIAVAVAAQLLQMVETP